jgi:hypothetical protein
MTKIEEITARKQELVRRSDDERNEITRVYYQWQARTAVARHVGSILRNPLVLAGIGLLLLKMPWRKTYKMGGWAWRLWKMVRVFRRMWI